MFKIELLSLVNLHKKCFDENEKSSLEEKMSTLINQNLDEYNQFLQTDVFDSETLELFENILSRKKINSSNDEHDTISETDYSNEKAAEEDIKKIKEVYSLWIRFFSENNFQLSEKNNDLIEKLINFYFGNRFEVLLKVLEIYEDDNFEKFKNHLKNKIREFIANKVKNYLDSSEYKSLGFFSKRKKNNEIENILNHNGEYEFSKINLSGIM